MSVRRDKYFEKNKELISYKKELEKYNGYRDKVFYEVVPLEKPIFAGWDVRVILNELGERSYIKEDLEAIIKYLKIDQPRFTKNLLFIKDIRKDKNNLSVLYKSKHNHNYHIDILNNRHISKKTFHNLPERIKNYFYVDRFYKYSSIEKPYYTIDFNDIKKYLSLKVSKSYYNCQKVPKSDLISDYTKLRNKIERNNLWDKLYINRYRDCFQKAIKLSAKKYCHLTKEEHNRGEEGLNDDNEPVLAKLSRLYDKKEFGWD